MERIDASSDTFTLRMTADEVSILRAALREVLYGFRFPDFEPRMGCSRAEAAALLDTLFRVSTEASDRADSSSSGPELAS